MSISEISLYNILRKKLGDQETSDLVEFVKEEIKSELDAKTSVFMTKDDKVDIIGRLQDDKLELIGRIQDNKLELIDRIQDNKLELIDRINKSKTETIVWIVGIGILQFLLTLLVKIIF